MLINNKMYLTKNVFLGYAKTIDANSCERGCCIKNLVIALYRGKKTDDYSSLKPIKSSYPYYTLNEVIPISKRIKKGHRWISGNSIEKIVEYEKEILESKFINENDMVQDNSKRNTNGRKIEHFINEIEIDKVKKFVS